MTKTERLVIRLHCNPQLGTFAATPTPPGTPPSPHRGYRPRRRSGRPSAPGRAIRPRALPRPLGRGSLAVARVAQCPLTPAIAAFRAQGRLGQLSAKTGRARTSLCRPCHFGGGGETRRGQRPWSWRFRHATVPAHDAC
jgi:hypothetical protein